MDIKAFWRQYAERLDELEQPERFAERQALVRTVLQRAAGFVYRDRRLITGASWSLRCR